MNAKGSAGAVPLKRWETRIKIDLGMHPGLLNAVLLEEPSGLANGPPFLEPQFDWVGRFLGELAGQSAKELEVKEDPSAKYGWKNLPAFDSSLAQETPSWWNGV